MLQQEIDSYLANEELDLNKQLTEIEKANITIDYLKFELEQFRVSQSRSSSLLF